MGNCMGTRTNLYKSVSACWQLAGLYRFAQAAVPHLLLVELLYPLLSIPGALCGSMQLCLELGHTGLIGLRLALPQLSGRVASPAAVLASGFCLCQLVLQLTVGLPQLNDGLPAEFHFSLQVVADGCMYVLQCLPACWGVAGPGTFMNLIVPANGADHAVALWHRQSGPLCACLSSLLMRLSYGCVSIWCGHLQF